MQTASEKTEKIPDKNSFIKDFFRAYTKDCSDNFEIKKTVHGGLTRFVLFQKNPHLLKMEITFYGNK